MHWKSWTNYKVAPSGSDLKGTVLLVTLALAGALLLITLCVCFYRVLANVSEDEDKHSGEVFPSYRDKNELIPSK